MSSSGPAGPGGFFTAQRLYLLILRKNIRPTADLVQATLCKVQGTISRFEMRVSRTATTNPIVLSCGTSGPPTLVRMEVTDRRRYGGVVVGPPTLVQTEVVDTIDVLSIDSYMYMLLMVLHYSDFCLQAWPSSSAV